MRSFSKYLLANVVEVSATFDWSVLNGDPLSPRVVQPITVNRFGSRGNGCGFLFFSIFFARGYPVLAGLPECLGSGTGMSAHLYDGCVEMLSLLQLLHDGLPNEHDSIIASRWRPSSVPPLWGGLSQQSLDVTSFLLGRL